MADLSNMYRNEENTCYCKTGLSQKNAFKAFTKSEKKIYRLVCVMMKINTSARFLTIVRAISSERLT